MRNATANFWLNCNGYPYTQKEEVKPEATLQLAQKAEKAEKKALPQVEAPVDLQAITNKRQKLAEELRAVEKQVLTTQFSSHIDCHMVLVHKAISSL